MIGYKKDDILETELHCGSDDAPADAVAYYREFCGGYSSTVTRTVCVGSGGFAYDPGDDPAPSALPASASRRQLPGVPDVLRVQRKQPGEEDLVRLRQRAGGRGHGHLPGLRERHHPDRHDLRRGGRNRADGRPVPDNGGH